MLMLLFQIGSDHYAIDANHIIEIFPKIKLKKIPLAQDYIAGLVNYGGKTVPVIDLSQLVIKRPSDAALSTRIILVRHPTIVSENHLLGLIAEKVTGTKELEQGSFKHSGIKTDKFPFFGDVYSKGDTTVQLFKVENLFDFIRDIMD
jgi:chemotaxis-related protein WspB